MDFFFSCVLFYINFVPLGVYKAELLFDSVEAAVTVYLELVLALGCSKAHGSPPVRGCCSHHCHVLSTGGS